MRLRTEQPKEAVSAGGLFGRLLAERWRHFGGPCCAGGPSCFGRLRPLALTEHEIRKEHYKINAV
jgi:hypothetical protein